MNEREPIVKGGQGRSDSEVEEHATFVWLVCTVLLVGGAVALMVLVVRPIVDWLAAGGMG